MADHDHDHEHEHTHSLDNDDEGQEFEREARRQLALARIRQYGDSVLRMKARDVETFDDDLERLVERMTTLMHEASGVGPIAVIARAAGGKELGRQPTGIGG